MDFRLLIVAIVCLFACSGGEGETEAVCKKECVTEVIDFDLTFECGASGCTKVPFDDIDTDIEVINLPLNNITLIPELSYEFVQTINLAYNNISMINDSAFKNCRYLKTANFSGNRIGPDVMNNGQAFKYFLAEHVYLSYNRITYLNQSEIFPQADNYMTYLDLSHNQMEYLAKESLQNLGELEILRLSHNRLRNLEADHFGDLLILDHLYLDHNELTTIESETFLGLGVRLLDLRYNRITSIASDAFVDMLDLNVLHMSHNELPVIKTGMFTDMEDLESIYIEHTKLVRIEKGAFPKNIRKISIQYAANLEVIDNATFSGLSRLEEVEIENNPRLFQIHQGAFDKLKSSVEIVYLRNNDLRTVDSQLVNWEIVQTADLTSNRLDCDCHILWMIDNLTKSALEPLQCYSPYSMRGTFIKDLKTEDFSCSFFKRHKFEGAIALIVMVSMVFLTVGVFLVYKYRVRIMPCWFGGVNRYDALYEHDEEGEDDEEEMVVSFSQNPSVANDRVASRLANGHSTPPPENV